jgi:hypothetical protein
MERKDGEISHMTQKKQIEKLKCIGECKRELPKQTSFYNTNSELYKNIGKIPICKSCIRKSINYDDMETIYALLRQFDIKFDIEYWNTALASSKDTFGRYMTMANSLTQFAGTGWKDSIFELSEAKEIEQTITSVDKKEKFIITDEIMDKWGYGYLDDEYKAFESKYAMLKNNYQEKTAMHTEALLTYIRYRVKEEMATAKNDMKAAKEWGQLAQKAAQDAKINPSQLSKSDLSDGLDTFGQLVRTVEQAVDIIPILPQFKERPQDMVDFTLLCYINYVRDLKGLPPAEYEEVYRFYDDRKKEYENRMDFLKDDEE